MKGMRWQLCLLLFLLVGFGGDAAQAGKGAGDEPVFACRYLSPEVRDKMVGVSWRQGCPVPLDDLRLVQVGYIDFAGKIRQGELVVHATVAREVRDIFRELYQARFPIAGMRLVDE